MAGIPGWALALAAPYGLEKFVIEPTQGVYNFAKGIRNDINAGEDDAFKQQALKKAARAKTVEDFENNIAELENTPFNDSATYQAALKENVTRRDELIKKERIGKSSNLVTSMLNSKNPEKELNDFVAKGGQIDLETLHEVDKGVQEARNLVKDTFERFAKKKEEDNTRQFHADVAPLFKARDDSGNVIPFEVKAQQVYELASKYNMNPEKALKDFETLYSKTMGPLQKFGTGRTSALGQANLFGDIKKDVQSVAPVINVNGGKPNGAMDGGGGYQYFYTQYDPKKPPIIEKVKIDSPAYERYTSGDLADRARPFGKKGQMNQNQAYGSFKFNAYGQTDTIDSKGRVVQSTKKEPTIGVAGNQRNKKQDKEQTFTREEALAELRRRGKID